MRFSTKYRAVQADPFYPTRFIRFIPIRHSPPGQAVEIAVERRDSKAIVQVRDFGPGVPEEALPRLFDAFYRVEKDRDRSSGGIGLGLSIARRAIELHKGSIRARNANPGLEVELELPQTSVTQN